MDPNCPRQSGTYIYSTDDTPLLPWKPSLDIHGRHVGHQYYHTVRNLEQCRDKIRISEPLDDETPKVTRRPVDDLRADATEEEEPRFGICQGFPHLVHFDFGHPGAGMFGAETVDGDVFFLCVKPATVPLAAVYLSRRKDNLRGRRPIRKSKEHKYSPHRRYSTNDNELVLPRRQIALNMADSKCQQPSKRICNTKKGGPPSYPDRLFLNSIPCCCNEEIGWCGA